MNTSEHLEKVRFFTTRGKHTRCCDPRCTPTWKSTPQGSLLTNHSNQTVKDIATKRFGLGAFTGGVHLGAQHWELFTTIPKIILDMTKSIRIEEFSHV